MTLLDINIAFKLGTAHKFYTIYCTFDYLYMDAFGTGLCQMAVYLEYQKITRIEKLYNELPVSIIL